jgi:hypothetical protein
MKEEDEGQEDREKVQAISIGHPIDIIIKSGGDTVLAGVGSDGGVEPIESASGALVLENLLTGKDAATNKRVVLVENDRTLRAQMVAWNYTGGAPIRVAAQPTTGELRTHTFLVGEDNAGNEDILLTNPDKILYTEERNPGEYVTPDDMPAGPSYQTYYTNNNTGFLVDVEIEVVNSSGSASDATVCLVENGGSAGSNRMILHDVPIAANQVGVRLGPYTLNVGGTVQGFSTANAVVIHVWVKELRRITP